jgi:hypothetical protein
VSRNWQELRGSHFPREKREVVLMKRFDCCVR